MKPKLTKNTLKHRELFKEYQKSVLKDLQVSNDQFKRIVKKFSQKLLDKVLLESEEVKLPIIGSLRIQKFKQNFSKNQLRVDWYLTKKHNKKIYHTNDHRDGFIYQYYWKKSRFTNKRYYSFLPERYCAKRRLAKILKTMPLEYFS